MFEKVNRAEQQAGFADHWRPRSIATLNGHDVMVVTVQGEVI